MPTVTQKMRPRIPFEQVIVPRMLLLGGVLSQVLVDPGEG
jgi:hypothetical protein